MGVDLLCLGIGLRWAPVAPTPVVRPDVAAAGKDSPAGFGPARLPLGGRLDTMNAGRREVFKAGGAARCPLGSGAHVVRRGWYDLADRIDRRSGQFELCASSSGGTPSLGTRSTFAGRNHE